jgi:psiF repeat
MSPSMRKAAVAAAFLWVFSPAWANDTPVKDKKPQQNRMAQCNQEAKAQTLKGEARKAFMKACLTNKPVAAAADKPADKTKDRLKACNSQAKGMKGDQRKAFLADCLKA